MKHLYYIASALFVLSNTAALAADAPPRKAPYTTTQVPIEKAGGFECDAKPVQYAIGKRVTTKLTKKLLAQSGSTIIRWLKPGGIMTMDYSASRINITTNSRKIITAITCG